MCVCANICMWMCAYITVKTAFSGQLPSAVGAETPPSLPTLLSTPQWA